MIALFALWRVAAWNSGRMRWLRSEERKGVLRWPDKSAAVGVGTGHWNDDVFSAVARKSLLAHGEFVPTKSMQIAPSAAIIHRADIALR
jgi:hypothetical protein